MRTTEYNLEYGDYYTPSPLGRTLVDSKTSKGDESQDKFIKYVVDKSLASIVEFDENSYEKETMFRANIEEIPDIDLDLGSKFKLGK